MTDHPRDDAPQDLATVFRGPYDDALALQVEFGALGIEAELVLEDNQSDDAELRVARELHARVGPLVAQLTASLLESEEKQPESNPARMDVDNAGRRICFMFASVVGAPMALLLAPAYFRAAREVPPSPRVHGITKICIAGSAVLTILFFAVLIVAR